MEELLKSIVGKTVTDYSYDEVYASYPDDPENIVHYLRLTFSDGTVLHLDSQTHDYGDGHGVQVTSN